MYPFAVSTTTCGKSVSWNTVPGLTYVVPVVFISVTPVDFTNLTSILSLGRSSLLGASGSVLLGSITTTCSLTINICLSTSIEEPSLKLNFSLPSCFPDLLESLVGVVISVTVPASIRSHTAFELLLSAGTRPSFQSILSPFQTLIV